MSCQINFCGTHVKWSDVPAGYDGPVYFDRFGNKYTEYELQRETESATHHCTGGAFVLNFIGGFSTEEEETICQADAAKYDMFNHHVPLVQKRALCLPIGLMLKPSFASSRLGA